MNELQSMLRDLESHVSASAAGRPEFSHSRARRTVRRKKTTRAVGVTTASVVGFGAVAFGTWNIAARALVDAIPAVSSSPTASASPSPSDAPSPTATSSPSPSATPAAAWDSPIEWSDRGTESDPRWALTRIEYPLPEGATEVDAWVAGTRGFIDIVLVEFAWGEIGFFEVHDGEWRYIAYPEGGSDGSDMDGWRSYLEPIPGATLDMAVAYADFALSPEARSSAFFFGSFLASVYIDPSAPEKDWPVGLPAPTPAAPIVADFTPQSVTTPITGSWIPVGLTVYVENQVLAGPAGRSMAPSVFRYDLASGVYVPLPVGDLTGLTLVSGVAAADLADSGLRLADGRIVMTPAVDSPLMDMVLASPNLDSSVFTLLSFSQGPSVYMTEGITWDGGHAVSVIAVPTDASDTYELWVVYTAAS